jgi:hypothetical protein
MTWSHARQQFEQLLLVRGARGMFRHCNSRGPRSRPRKGSCGQGNRRRPVGHDQKVESHSNVFWTTMQDIDKLTFRRSLKVYCICLHKCFPQSPWKAPPNRKIVREYRRILWREHQPAAHSTHPPKSLELFGRAFWPRDPCMNMNMKWARIKIPSWSKQPRSLFKPRILLNIRIASVFQSGRQDRCTKTTPCFRSKK